MDSATNGFIYLSLGSNTKSKLLPKEILEIFANTFANLSYKVLWKFENDSFHVPPNVFISKWTPQQGVLGKLKQTSSYFIKINTEIINCFFYPYFSSSEHQALHLSRRAAEHRRSGSLRRPAHRNTVCLRSGVPSYENGFSESCKIPRHSPAYEVRIARCYNRSHR